MRTLIRPTAFVDSPFGHDGKVAQLAAAARPAGLRGIVLVGSGPAKPAAAVTPEYRQTLSHAYDSDESAAWALDHVLTATALPAPVRAPSVSSRSAIKRRQRW